MKHTLTLSVLGLVSLLLFAFSLPKEAGEQLNILVFTKTKAYRH